MRGFFYSGSREKVIFQLPVKANDLLSVKMSVLNRFLENDSQGNLVIGKKSIITKDEFLGGKRETVFDSKISKP